VDDSGRRLLCRWLDEGKEEYGSSEEAVKKMIIVPGGYCVGGDGVVVKKSCGKFVSGGVDGSTML
jgi:hypothetical protein